jgi:cation transport ATPase
MSVIESAARINAFVFDKTGTLTTGKLAVSVWRARLIAPRRALTGTISVDIEPSFLMSV